MSKRPATPLTDMGSFAKLLHIVPRGRDKGVAWLMKAIVNIYADFAVHHDHISRDGEKAQFEDFTAFVHHWHLSRFGLRHIAERALADLVATAQKHIDESHKAKVLHLS